MMKSALRSVEPSEHLASVPVVSGVSARFMYAAFFVSGLSALIYEVAWLSRIQLVMGHTVYSLATTLSSYLTGLALGALLSARLVRARRHAFSLYLGAEAAIGVYGLLFTALLSVVQIPYGWLVTQFTLPLIALSAVQFLVCGALILFPTILMGTTLPLLVQATSDSGRDVSRLPRLYAVNTMGAFSGCLLAGFFLLPKLGYTKSMYVAAGLNLGILAVALLFMRGTEFPRLTEVMGYLRESRKPAVVAQTPLVRSALAILFVSGFASMVVQMGWGRLAALVFGPSAYVFPLVTAVVLLGIVIGSWLTRKATSRAESAQAAFVVVPLLAAGSLLLGNAAFVRMPNAILWLHQNYDVGFKTLSLIQFSLLAVSCLPAAVFLGALFPVAANVLSQASDDEAAAIGRGYALNIAGFILGGLAVSFVVLPAIGLEMMMSALAATLLLVSAFSALGVMRRPLLAVTVLGLGLVAARVVPAFDWSLLTAGHFYNRVPRIAESDLTKLGYTSVADYTMAYETRLVAKKDDPHATISIHEGVRYTKDRAFKINGKVDGNNGTDLQTTRFVALLPALLAGKVERVLTIGLGTGSTVAETLRYNGLKQSTVIELSQAMIEFSKNYFYEISKSLWEDDRVRVINRDGRDFLEHTTETFDLVISEPSNPWVDGVGSLFTKEYYTSISRRLNPGGVAALWFHSYGLDCKAVMSVVAAANEVFPVLHVFRLGGDLYMLASNDPSARLHAVAKEHFLLEDDLLMLGKGLPNPDRAEAYKAFVANTFLFSKTGASRFTAHADVNRDDTQVLQFRSGETYYQRIACDGYLSFGTKGELESAVADLTRSL